MNGVEIAAVITAGTGAIVAVATVIGKGASYVISLTQTQANTTIEAKDEELKAKDERIQLLEGKLRKAGIDP